MESFVELDRFRDMNVEKARDRLPEDLEYSNPPETPLPFCNEYDYLTRAFFYQHTILELCLHDGNHLQ